MYNYKCGVSLLPRPCIFPYSPQILPQPVLLASPFYWPAAWSSESGTNLLSFLSLQELVSVGIVSATWGLAGIFVSFVHLYIPQIGLLPHNQSINACGMHEWMNEWNGAAGTWNWVFSFQIMCVSHYHGDPHHTTEMIGKSFWDTFMRRWGI